MITVPEAAKKIVMRSRYLSEAMSKGIINNSSLARYIKPEIEEMLLKKISNSSIIMALQRMSLELKPKYFKGSIFRTVPQIIVRSSMDPKEIKNLEVEGLKFKDLSSITIELPSQAIKTPGILYFFIKSLAWEGINIININSSAKDVTLIFEKKDINRAFNIVQSLFSKSV